MTVGAGYGPVVPVEFLTEEQAEAYGTFTEAPRTRELERFFFLDDGDRDLLAVPWEVVEYPAGKLGIAGASCVNRYPERRRTPYEHAMEIQECFRYRDFADRKRRREFRGFLYGRRGRTPRGRWRCSTTR